MSSMFLRNAIIVSALLGVAVSAQAQVNLSLTSAGTGSDTSGIVTSSETVYNEWGGAGVLSSLSYSWSLGTDTGTGTYTGAGGTLDFSFTIDSTSELQVGDSAAADGSWLYTGGTGGYAGFTEGGGTLDANYFITGATANTLSFQSSSLFSGTLATPEPAPFVAMGLGVVGLMVRRRRK